MIGLQRPASNSADDGFGDRRAELGFEKVEVAALLGHIGPAGR